MGVEGYSKIYQIGWVEKLASRCVSSSLQIQILTSVFYIKFIILNNQLIKNALLKLFLILNFHK